MKQAMERDVTKRQWYYRGSLKSCNYSCSYCPFAKRTCSRRSIQADREAFFRFTGRMLQQQKGGAVQIVPYGEALIHPYYWEGLAALSRSPVIDAVGAQSNFSFPTEEMLSVYREHGGELKKLRLWGTFHPEMISAEQFARHCRFLTEQKISYCVGAVGVPEYLEQIRMLRKALPDSVYLWINKMDGLGRRYTEAELEAFAEIDGYFRQELKHYRADLTACADSRFVEADGMMRRCNISRENIGNFYEDSVESKKEELSGCKRKTCSCYLAYCNRRDAVAPFFRPYPAFRIPVYPKAVFFDIDGTLVPEGLRRIPEHTARGLLRLSVRCEIYLATSLPLEAAKRKLSSVWHVFRGGVFANGARWQTQSQKKGSLDVILPMEAGWLTGIKEKQKAYGFKVHVYRKKADIYKVTLSFHRVRRGIQMPEQKQKELADALKIPDSCRILWEGNCMQITKQGTGKLAGILEICRAMGYRREDVTAVGDSLNDREMIEFFS